MLWLIPMILGGGLLLSQQKNVKQRAQEYFGPFLPPNVRIGTEVFGPPAPPINQKDLDTLARTLWGEARGEGERGMHAVANVIMNRYALAQRSSNYARQFGRTVDEICRKPNQFSAWNSNDPNRQLMLNITQADAAFRLALNVADRALRGTLPDITGGADHYLNIPVTIRIRGGSLPPWVDLNRKTAAFGSHTFLRLA